MFIEQRTYSLVPGGVAEYLRLWQAHGRAIQESHLGTCAGCFSTEFGDINQHVYHWAFDSLDARARRRAALMADAGFKDFRGQVRHLLVKQENRLLLPALPPLPGITPQAGGAP